jgi:hypothetical protein
MPVVTASPAVIAALILLTYSLRIFDAYKPRWTKPFIQETKEKAADLDGEPKHKTPIATLSLLAIAVLGLALQVMTVFFPTRQIIEIYPSIAWVSTILVSLLVVILTGSQGIAAVIVVVERPRTASTSLLLLFSTLLVAQLVVLSHAPHVMSRARAEDLPSMLGPFVALMGIITILNMPFRDPTMPNDDISPVYGSPTVNLRTPEDNLTPWQYMTVAWMAPMVQEGYKRQLDDEDVWDLPWEFKHARLHQTFRQLPGSVTKRVFTANGMDLIRTTTMNLVRLGSSE